MQDGKLVASSGGMAHEQCTDCREIRTGKLFALQPEVLESSGIIRKETVSLIEEFRVLKNHV